jgi:NADH-quinone oxidoreductase subunit M
VIVRFAAAFSTFVSFVGVLVLGFVVGQSPCQAGGLRAEPDALVFAHPGDARVLRVSNDGELPIGLVPVHVAHVTGAPDLAAFAVGRPAQDVLAPGETVELNVIYSPPAGSTLRRQVFAALQIGANQVVSAGFAGNGNAAGRHVGPALSVALRAGEQRARISWIIFFPLFGIPLLWLVPRGRESLTRLVALAATAVPLAGTLRLAQLFDPHVGVSDPLRGLQFVEHVVWIRSLRVEYFVGLDGLSLSLLLLTTVVTFLAVLASFSIALSDRIRGYFALLLLLETGMLGVFVAFDFFLFYVFWEVMLLPMYFLVGMWGGPRRIYAAIKFFLYTLLGSVLLLLAILALYFASHGTSLIDGTPSLHTLDMIKLAHGQAFDHAPALLGLGFSKVVWVLFFVGFAIKVPVLPFHTWLPDAHVEAPTAISVILAGVLLKMGTYGLWRANWAMLPDATLWAADAVGWLGVAGILYGGLCAMAQTDLKRMVAYSSVSHMGYCLLGMASLTEAGLSGAVVQMVSHGLITSLLFLCVGVLYDRTHERDKSAFGGLAGVMPRYAFFFGFAFMASLGLPGLSGFIGEFLVFTGAFPLRTAATSLAALGLVLTAAYHLDALSRVQLGPFSERWRMALVGHDLTVRELASLLPLAALVLVLGLHPAPLLELVNGSVHDLLAAFGGDASKLVGPRN